MHNTERKGNMENKPGILKPFITCPKLKEKKLADQRAVITR